MKNKALANLLISDDTFAHRWLCHPDRECEDGCEGEGADPKRVAFYKSLDARQFDALRQ